MVWYGATDPRGKLDFFDVGRVQISEIICDFLAFFVAIAPPPPPPPPQTL